MFDPTRLQTLSKQTLSMSKDLHETIATKCHIRGSRIFVYEDDDNIRNIVTQVLRKAEYRVADNANGADLLETLKANDIGLLITDLNVPMLDGMGTFRSAKSSKKRTAFSMLGSPSKPQKIVMISRSWPRTSKK